MQRPWMNTSTSLGDGLFCGQDQRNDKPDLGIGHLLKHESGAIMLVHTTS